VNVPLSTAWWPLTPKVAKAFVAYSTIEAAAVVGELATGTPGWALVAAGAIPGGVALVVAYVTSSPE
jgi:hypothetical protein